MKLISNMKMKKNFRGTIVAMVGTIMVAGMLAFPVPVLGSGTDTDSAEGGLTPAAIQTGNLPNSHTPALVTQMPVDVPVTTALAAGSDHALALTDEGEVWAWGQNQYGQLGQGTKTNLKIPRQVDGLPAIKAIAAGAFFSLALSEDGQVYAWGNNEKHQLGIGESEDVVTEPVRLSGLEGIVEIDAGWDHAMARKADGTVYVWGDNEHGQLCTDDMAEASRPVEVEDAKVTGIQEMAAGCDHCLVRKADGTLLAWGDNTYGQLGDGTSVSRSYAVSVSGLDDVKQISAGLVSSLALTEEGSAYSWGHTAFGELGLSSCDNYFVNHPYKITSISQVRKIEMGFYNSFFIMENDTVKATGENFDGQLGTGDNSSHGTPVLINSLDNVSQVAAGGEFTMALLKDGTVLSWGDNAWGQLGTGVTDESAYSTNPDTYLPQVCLGGHWGGPVMESSSPAAGNTLHNLDASIEIVFDTTVEAGSNLANLTLVNGDGEEVQIHRTVDGCTVTLDPVQSLEAGRHYTVKIVRGSLQDLAGNENQSASEFHFNT